MVAPFFDEEHRIFRDSVRKFIDREMLPFLEDWEKAGHTPRELWRKAGEQGFLCMDVPDTFGGLGLDDYRYSMIVAEEMTRTGGAASGFLVHTDMVAPYIIRHGTEDQKRRYLPGMVSGECIGAVAMTEPGTGSDLAAIQTIAAPKGDHYLLNGQKTFITNGAQCDMVIVAAKTAPEQRHEGVSLFLVDRGMDGFETGRILAKMGLHAQDTAELFFRDVRVPRENLIGREGEGFLYLMQGLPRERLTIAVSAVASAAYLLEITTEYCRQRTAFGRPIGAFQHNRFTLATIKTEVEIGRAFIEHCVTLHNAGELSAEKAAMAKWWTTEMQVRTVDACVQLHGGYGYMMEYPVARAYVDSRAQTIYGGTTEIMKEIIGRSMGF